MKYSFYIVIFLIFTACQSNKKEASSKEDNQVEVDRSDKMFTVTLKAIVQNDDIFSLLYTTAESDSWSSDHLIKQSISGKDYAQDIVFKFPEEDFPVKLRIDLGTNRDQKVIDLYKINFSYLEEQIEVKEAMISKYFICNKYAQYVDTGKADVKTKTVGNNYNPLIIATDYFMNRIDINLYK